MAFCCWMWYWCQQMFLGPPENTCEKNVFRETIFSWLYIRAVGSKVPMEQICPKFWLRRTLEQSFGSLPDCWAFFKKITIRTVWAIYILPAALIGVNWSKAYSTCTVPTLTVAGCFLNKIPAVLHPWTILSLSRDELANFYPLKEMQAGDLPKALFLVGKPLTATHLAGIPRKPPTPTM